jgi:ubiquinone/menaquinone biosynthesis C-methylase UbiE
MTKPADDPNVDYKTLVREGYDRCAGKYAGSRQGIPPPELALLIEKLPSGAAVLDIGCGCGLPICRELTRHADVTGIDISPAMITLARRNVPTGTFACGDIMCVEFPDSSFDAVTAFYTVFHLPRQEHEELFRRIRRWLKPSGYLMTTLNLRDEEPYTEDGFFGVTMYWSNFDLPRYREMLTDLGFSILIDTRLGHGYKNGLKQAPEVHPLIFAQKT